MRRLNFLQDDPWDEVDNGNRVRWFGHPFGTDQLGASLIEYLPRSPGGAMHMHYGLEEMSSSSVERRPSAPRRERRSYHPATSSTSRKAQTGCTRSRTPRMSP